MRGCTLLFDGDDETPLLSASTVITKYVAGSGNLSLRMTSRSCSVVPPAQVGKRMPLDLSELSVPYVR